MKILLAAGVFYPDIGGPAIHVQKIAERLVNEGYKVQVVTYGNDPQDTKFDFDVERISRKWQKALQWIMYSVQVILHAANSEVIYAFDLTAAGLPARIASLIFRRPFIIRVGGDPIWEREVEMNRRFMPIDDYYRQGLHLEDKPGLFRIIKWILYGAKTVVVYNQNFKDFYVNYFRIESNKIQVIENPVFKRGEASQDLPDDPMILFAGRLVSYKNLPRVIKVFSKLRFGRLLLVGAGPEKDGLVELARSLDLKDKVEFKDPLLQEKLFDLIKNSSLCIAPALSEFNPNFILESLSFGKPVLISQGHGLSIDLPEEFVFDPQDEDDLERKLKIILNKENYKGAVSKIRDLNMNRIWDDVTDSHLAIINRLI